MSLERLPKIPENVLYYTEKEGHKNAVLIFQGQGSQEVGMGRDLCVAYPEVRELYQRADNILRAQLKGGSLLDLTEEQLKNTGNTQLAKFTHSEACRIAFVKQRESKGLPPIKPKYYVGNSLGLFNALLAAGAFSFEDGLRIIHARGKAMQRACEENPSGLIAVTISGIQDGSPDDNQKALFESVIKRLKEKKDHKKNAFGLYDEAINSDAQVVLGGFNEDLDKAEAWLNEIRGPLVQRYGQNIKFTRLNVAGAFHSPLMEPAVPRVKEVIKRLRKLKRIKKLKVPVIANTTAIPIRTPGEIEEEITHHLTEPVQWKDTIEFLEKQGIAATVEIGKKTILSNMMRHKGKMVAGAGVAGVIAAGVAAFVYFKRRQ